MGSSGLSSAELVAAIRSVSGETQEGLARRMGVSFPTVNAWERGKYEPRSRHRKELERLAAELGIRHTTSVMIIDDDESTIEVISSMMGEFDPNIGVNSATNGSEGLLRCGITQPELLFLDILMPGIDGLEVARQISAIEALGSMSLVFITSSDDNRILTQAHSLGDSVLPKPLDPDEVFTVLQDTLGPAQGT